MVHKSHIPLIMTVLSQRGVLMFKKIASLVTFCFICVIMFGNIAMAATYTV